MKPFDNHFADNVREVFDAWDEPVDEQAWQDMKSRLTGKKKNAFLFMLPVKVVAAAMVLIIAGASVWLIFNNKNQLPVAQLQHTESPDFPSTGGVPEGRGGSTGGVPEGRGGSSGGVPEGRGGSTGGVPEGQGGLSGGVPESQNSIFGREPEKQSEMSSGITSEPGNAHTGVTVEQGRTSAREAEHQAGDSPGVAGEHRSTIAENANTFTDSSSGTDLKNDIMGEPETALAASIPPAIALADANIQVVEDVSELALASQQESNPDEMDIIAYNISFMDKKKEVKAPGNGVELTAGSMKTYSMAELAGGMGYSAGVLRHWNLGERWSIGSGGVILYNSFTLDNARAATTARNEDFFASPDLANSGNDFVQLQDDYTSVDFAAIDLPINFRYALSNLGKGKVFLTAGLSSLLYLQQNFTSKSNMVAFNRETSTSGDIQYSTEVTRVTTSGSYNALKRFDLGRFLNLSLGYKLRRDRQSLLIEPYVKLPIGNVTSMDLNIGMAGVSFKYDFSGR